MIYQYTTFHLLYFSHFITVSFLSQQIILNLKRWVYLYILYRKERFRSLLGRLLTNQICYFRLNIDFDFFFSSIFQKINLLSLIRKVDPLSKIVFHQITEKNYGCKVDKKKNSCRLTCQSIQCRIKRVGIFGLSTYKDGWPRFRRRSDWSPT